jgi:WD40 repeat protein
MHHKRVVQEKAKLIADLKTLKKNYGEYEPALKQLQAKYEIAMKEKMMAKIERDKFNIKVSILEERVRSIEKATKEPPITYTDNQQSKKEKKELKDFINPYQNSALPIAKIDKLAPISQIQAHSLTISSIKFHPKKPILATVSDDKNWKLWSFPTGELIMSGQGHKDWISDCDFHPK